MLMVAILVDAPVLSQGVAARVETVDESVPGAVRVSLSSSGDAESIDTRVGAHSIAFDPGSGDLTVEYGGAVWSGRVRALDRFGRTAAPGLEIAWSVTEGESLYGLGERFDAFDLNGRLVNMWIVDEPGQGDGDATYFVTPVLYSSEGYGFFAEDNPEGVFDLNSSGDGWHRYQRVGEAASIVIAFGDSVPSLVRDRTTLIGGLTPVPDWAYEPWISKNSYETQEEAEAAMGGMRERGLPFGVIVLEAWKGPSETGEFNRFSTERWHNVEGFFDWCVREDVKVVLWQVPILHPSSPWFEEAAKKGYLVRDPKGEVSLREEWLAGFGNIDFYKPEAVRFYKDMLRPVVRLGVSGFKADDGEAIKPDDVLGDGITGVFAHNEWSTLYNRATFDVLQEEGFDGMIWARSGSLGIEKSPALWAGDQFAEWPQLQRLIIAGLSSSLSGMPFWSHDIGGYVGTCSPELYIRWLQFGALSPFMQFHGIEPREPWHFGDQAVDAYRLLANLRMNIVPALIDIGLEASATGIPIMRPMFFETGEHDGVVDQYMLGDSMLVAPVMDEGAFGRVVRFPAGRWLHAFVPMAFDGPGSFEVPIGMVDAPLFFREGAEIRLAVNEGEQIGKWVRGTSPRDVVLSPEELWDSPAVLSNLSAPQRGNPLKRVTTIECSLSRAEIDEIVVQWWFEDAPHRVERVAVREVADGRASFDIPAPSATGGAGRVQRYTITHKDHMDTPLAQAAIDWRDLVRVEIKDPFLNVVTEGETRVRGTFFNRTSVPLSIDVTLEALCSSTDGWPRSQRLDLSPSERVGVTWTVDIPHGSGTVGDERLSMVALLDDRELDRDQAALIRSPVWLVAGPFQAESKIEAFSAIAPAEWVFDAAAVFESDDGAAVRWERVDSRAVSAMNGLDFNRMFGLCENTFVYAMTLIESDREQDVQLRLGTDDTIAVWVNDELLVSEVHERGIAPDQNTINARFVAGVNRVMVKVAQGRGGWGMVFRVTASDGSPAVGLSDAVPGAGFDPRRVWSGENARRVLSLTWSLHEPLTLDSSTVRDIERLIERGTFGGDTDTVRKWHARDVSGVGLIDLNALLGASRASVTFALSEFKLEHPTEIEVRAGSDDGLVVWINRERVIDADRPRAFTANEDVARLRLEAGQHTIVARVSQGTGQWGFDLRLWDVSTLPHRPIGSPRRR
ncbi:MAG: TIM-barrel domain-containing protein [Planctomycetota bacterium]